MHNTIMTLKELKKCFVFSIELTYTHQFHYIYFASMGLDLLLPSELPFNSWPRSNKVLETFLTNFGPYWHGSITVAADLWAVYPWARSLFHHTPVLYLDWAVVTVKVIWIQWTYRRVQKTSMRSFELTTWCIILLEADIVNHAFMLFVPDFDPTTWMP